MNLFVLSPLLIFLAVLQWVNCFGAGIDIECKNNSILVGGGGGGGGGGGERMFDIVYQIV